VTTHPDARPLGASLCSAWAFVTVEDNPKAEVVKNIMPKDAFDGGFTTVEEVAETSLIFAALERADRPVAGREPRRVHAMTPCPFRAS